MNEPLASFDSRTLRNTVGRFATGVTIITGQSPAGVDMGLTANSFSSVSLDPPLLLFCLAQTAGSRDAFTQGRHFAVNILSADQQELSNRFAKPSDDKFEGLDVERWDSGVAVLPACLANLECAIEQCVDAGDHVIVIGRVLQLRATEAGDASDPQPLLFFGGGYAGLK